MKNKMKHLILLTAVLIAIPFTVQAQTDPLKAKVDDLVLKHYIDGIQYVEANALGDAAVPYLVELLNNPDVKEYWVEIIVTLGFIESSSALNPLISFLEEDRGEVDGHTFRALQSVPFAIGSIASNGDARAMNYLIDEVNTPDDAPAKWSYRGRKIHRDLAEQAIIGLSISGHPRARAELLKLKDDIELKRVPKEREAFIEHIRDGLVTMDRMEKRGRSQMFNPQR